MSDIYFDPRDVEPDKVVPAGYVPLAKGCGQTTKAAKHLCTELGQHVWVQIRGWSDWGPFVIRYWIPSMAAERLSNTSGQQERPTATCA